MKILHLYSVLFGTRKTEYIIFLFVKRLFHIQPFGFSCALTIDCKKDACSQDIKVDKSFYECLS